MRSHKPNKPSTAVALLERGTQALGTSVRGQVAIPADYIQVARGLAVDSRSPGTRKEYARCWRDYARWCDEHGRDPLPAIAAEQPASASKAERADHTQAYAAAKKEALATVIAYVSWMHSQEARGRSWGGPEAAPVPLAITSIAIAVSAIKLAARTAGHNLDWEAPAFTETMKGMRRRIAAQRTVRQATPISPSELRDVLDMMKPERLRDARDAALLALGWGGCKRVSEFVGLDWLEKGKGSGFIRIEKEGVFMTLLKSKTSQDKPEQFVITRNDTPRLVEAVERWVELAKVERGQPVLRGVMGREGTVIQKTRMGKGNVSPTIKSRMDKLFQARDGKGRKKLSTAERKAKVRGYSSHSLRVGAITSMHDRGIPIPRIQSHSGHKTAAMVIHYGVVADKLKDHPNKGVGL